MEFNSNETNGALGFPIDEAGQAKMHGLVFFRTTRPRSPNVGSRNVIPSLLTCVHYCIALLDGVQHGGGGGSCPHYF
jgi:hypothetical protein